VKDPKLITVFNKKHTRVRVLEYEHIPRSDNQNLTPTVSLNESI